MLQINSINDLHSLLAGKFPKEKISLHIPCGNSKYEDRLNGYIKDCGCSMGTFFMLTAFGVTAIIFPLVATSLWHKLSLGALFCFILAIVGKFIGLFMARINFYNTVKELIENFPESKIVSA